jgi:hypothetical protein
MAIDLMPGFGAFTVASSGLAIPSFPGASAVQRVVSPNWAGGTSLTTGQADPLGGTEAILIGCTATETAGGGGQSMSGDADGVVGSYVSSNTYTMSMYVKHNTGASWVRFAVFDTGSGDAGCYFNSANGAIGDYRSGGTTESNAGVIDYGGGWYQIYFSYPMTTTTRPASVQVGIRSASDPNFDAGSAVTAGDGFYIWRWQVVNGTNPNG